MPRKMPKKGFYVIKKDDMLVSRGYKEAIYTSGVRGGGKHKYCRTLGNCIGNPTNMPMEWVTLLWSCVPAQSELDSDYDYYENFEDIPKDWEFPDFPS
jgi:hypothetical protein